MKRSEINRAIINATNYFASHDWVLPPTPKWDVTDFGLGSFLNSGLVLVNLAEEVEYCEKVMYVVKDQVTPAHKHKKKKEDIICRKGNLVVKLWGKDPAQGETLKEVQLNVKVNGQFRTIVSGQSINLCAGERVTIEPGLWHEFYATSEECIVGEVSTANDDLKDNFFSDRNIGRFSEITEDESPIVKLVSEEY